MLNAKTQIYKGKYISLYIDNISTSDVIFTFSGHGANPKNLYGDGFIQQLGFSGVFFVSLANHWWQTPELNEAINIANENTKTHSNRIAYGQSMGGYGALLCAARLKSRVVVTAPQTTLDARKANISQAWMKDISQFPIIRDNVEDELMSVDSIKIFYDNKNSSDVSHVEHLKTHINWLDEYTIPYATHNLPRTLKEMGLITSLISESFKNEKTNKIEFRKKIRANKAKSISYILNLRRHTEKSKNKWLHPFYKKIATSYIEKEISKVRKNDFIASDDDFRDLNCKLISMNQHVEIYDADKLLFLSRGNDPQLVYNDIPDSELICRLSFFSNTASYGNIFFLRKSSPGFSPNDAISFSVKSGINHVIFKLSSIKGNPLEKIRIDPISCSGFFQILEFKFEPSEEKYEQVI